MRAMCRADGSTDNPQEAASLEGPHVMDFDLMEVTLRNYPLF